LARDGKLDEALQAAEERGFEKVLASASAIDLMLLGDAARLNRQWKRADQAYRTVRRRFSEDKQAAAAAFALGRMTFDQHRRYKSAARWFEVYLSEQKEGTLAREAKGRLMEARHRSGDAVGARKAARRYLASYPAGPHAPFARKLLAKGKDKGADQ
jgi:TolA-binding protein